MRALLLLAAVLAAPVALAGTPEEPEVADPAGDTRLPLACADILAAWVEADEAGALTFHMEVAECGAPPGSMNEFWGIRFLVGEQEYFLHSYWDAQAAACSFWHGRFGPDGTQDHVPGACAYTPGAPARLDYPYSPEVAVLAPGETLVFGPVHSGLVNGRNEDLELDTATATRDFARPALAADPPASADAAARAVPAAPIAALAALALAARRAR